MKTWKICISFNLSLQPLVIKWGDLNEGNCGYE